MKWLLAGPVMVLILSGADFTRPDLTLLEDQQLDGTWLCVTYASGGTVQADKDVWTFRGEKFNCNGSAWLVKRRPEVNARAIDLVIGNGPSYLPAIWKVEDGKLLICYMPGSTPRPTRFAPAGGSVLRTFKRLKP